MGPGDRDRLRAVGLRVTRPRLAVLRALEVGSHLDAASVAQVTRAKLPKLSRQAVYDILNALVRAGLARRIEPAGHPCRYERRVGDNHHHLVCRRCGRVVDVDCVTGQPPCMTPSDSAGFALDETEVVFWGVCPRCQLAAHR
jgi:Fe2+ or Zn2+ uptake regulation protein